MGRGCGQVVSVLAFYFDDPSSNPADAYSFSVKSVYEKNGNKQKEAGVGPFKGKKGLTEKFLDLNHKRLGRSDVETKTETKIETDKQRDK